MKLAIIGAGLTGLAAAHRLGQLAPAAEVTLFERERVPGGRASSAERQGAIFDTGAQFLRAPTPDLEQLLRQALPPGTLVDIERPVWVFDGAGCLAAGDPAQNAEPKWTCSLGLSRLGNGLANRLKIRYDCQISRFEARAGCFQLHSDQESLGSFDGLLLTPPAPAAARLIEASDLPEAARSSILAELTQVSYRPCLSITLACRPALRPRPWYALVNSDKRHPISWLAYEHLKPERPSGGWALLTAQMGPAWSTEHWAEADDALAESVAGLVADLLDEPLPRPDWSDVTRWPWALPDGRANRARLESALPGLSFAGDFTAGLGRVHLAIEEGWRAAERLAGLANGAG